MRSLTPKEKKLRDALRELTPECGTHSWGLYYDHEDCQSFVCTKCGLRARYDSNGWRYCPENWQDVKHRYIWITILVNDVEPYIVPTCTENIMMKAMG